MTDQPIKLLETPDRNEVETAIASLMKLAETFSSPSVRECIEEACEELAWLIEWEEADETAEAA